MQEQMEHVDENAIRAKAHELWIQRGCPKGTAEEDWYRAEQILKAQVQRPIAAAVTDVAAPTNTGDSVRPKEPLAHSNRGPRQRTVG
jgi:hypothetical protein